ncbi:MAG: hypothetical protein HXY34_05515 [Candidatus Thorarchaeota archaeon]|nr:hypothetical protein [Candidatus Thorarchaeota archaeon]
MDSRSLDAVSERLGVSFALNYSQQQEIDTAGQVQLTIAQLVEATRSLCPDRGAAVQFLKEHLRSVRPLSLALFVTNPATQKIMERKRSYPDKMLPMLTVPWFHWEPGAETKDNPEGVKREVIGDLAVDIDRHDEVVFTGECGDFSGLVEARLVERPEGRPILIPAGTGRKDLVAHYVLRQFRLRIRVSGPDTQILPDLSRDFDYRYCDSPRTFHDLGLSISGDGSLFRLKTGQYAENALRGDVVLLLGLPAQTGGDSSRELLGCMWLIVLEGLVRERYSL